MGVVIWLPLTSEGGKTGSMHVQPVARAAGKPSGVQTQSTMQRGCVPRNGCSILLEQTMQRFSARAT